MSLRSWIPRILTFAAALILALPALASAAPPRAIPGELIIRYRSDATPNARANYRARLQADRVKEFRRFDMEHVRLRGNQTVEQALRRYSRDPAIEYVEPNYEITLDAIPNDPRFPELYGMRNTGQTGGTPGADIKATNAWDVFTGDPNIKIGVIDTGVDYNHPDLAANAWTNPGEIAGNGIDDDANGYVDDIHGYDFVNNDGDPMDDHGHGTHVAGTIGAVGNNGVGVVGVNWTSTIMALKVFNSSGQGSDADATLALNYATMMKQSKG
ncbi:MAG TPA: S8 family serine peptidase, partial [Gemmatimonadaceae bacterium]|nr:S8 family serine peptidase [Gemmatimonadaceae bacterium]